MLTLASGPALLFLAVQTGRPLTRKYLDPWGWVFPAREGLCIVPASSPPLSPQARGRRPEGGGLVTFVPSECSECPWLRRSRGGQYGLQSGPGMPAVQCPLGVTGPVWVTTHVPSASAYPVTGLHTREHGVSRTRAAAVAPGAGAVLPVHGLSHPPPRSAGFRAAGGRQNYRLCAVRLRDTPSGQGSGGTPASWVHLANRHGAANALLRVRLSSAVPASVGWARSSIAEVGGPLPRLRTCCP